MSTQVLPQPAAGPMVGCDRHPDRLVFRTVLGTHFCQQCFEDPNPPKVPLGPSQRIRYVSLETTEKMAKSYVALCGESSCIRCGTKKPVRDKLLCHPCRRRIRQINEIKCRLRSYRDHGDLKCLQNAMAMVRRYGIKPEELRGC